MKKIIVLVVAIFLVVIISLPLLLNDGGTGTDKNVVEKFKGTLFYFAGMESGNRKIV